MASNVIKDIQHALANRYKIALLGGGTKTHLPGPDVETRFDMTAHHGIVNYEPTELVITAKAGTLISDIEDELAKQQQYLPFEPPRGLGRATLGGVVATASSGPARPFRGAVRDHVLGVSILNGNGQPLRFGGQVIKNVAGYDVSRLMCGACGTLGVLDEISIKVLPRPRQTATASLALSDARAQQLLQTLHTQPLPLSASTYLNQELFLRFDTSVNALKDHELFQHATWHSTQDAEHLWHAVKERSHSFFNKVAPLWRLAVPEHLAWNADENTLIEWNGCLRWYFGVTPPAEWKQAAHDHGGKVYLANQHNHQPFENLPKPLALVHAKLKQAFDPEHLINPHIRFHP